MAYITTLALWTLSAVAFSPINNQYERSDLANVVDRALPDSPSGGYAPAVVDCPKTLPSIRLANGLSSNESSWLNRRRNNTIEPLRTVLERANLSDFDVGSFLDSNKNNATGLPDIGIAISGGGYRALMNGAGFLSAADSRNRDNGGNGSISGLLQASTYLAGLSGGGWLVGSMFANNFSTVPDMQDGENGTALWRFNSSIFRGPEEKGIGLLNSVQYWTEIVDDVHAKEDGWNTTLTDYWGRALSYQLIGAAEGGPGYTFSSIADQEFFQNASAPFPILVSDERPPGEKIVAINTTIYEFNPFELGSWDPTTYGFAPLRYIASNFTNGTISKDGKCVRGFDQLGFVIGTSSSLFNQALLYNITATGNALGLPPVITNAIEKILQNLDQEEDDIAQYTPNPFLGWDPTNKSINANDNQLSLVDGGEDLENIPLQPLIQPFRDVDIIFAIDSSADTSTYWPNGTALRATYDRAGTNISNHTLFPPVPSANTFLNLNLSRNPTLFGCDPSNFTLSGNVTVPPLIFYIPNAPYSTLSNVSTFDPAYPTNQSDAIIRNGLNAATQGNGTVDKEWSTCVACAIMSRSWWKAGIATPASCKSCFDRYCWNGTTDDASVGNYTPSFIVGEDFKMTNGTQNEGNAGVREEIGSTWALILGLSILFLI
ncbi:unnamed protein product [Clonostachys rhizophaga]|uniref:Lysophospholipase n=1 Tax=Clonostachys rhizophaga TaxID=160324 RepID=A0A9N9VK70_9HYPO|nr:unnamed protein product [Clonostachys rhizophaga]